MKISGITQKGSRKSNHRLNDVSRNPIHKFETVLQFTLDYLESTAEATFQLHHSIKMEGADDSSSSSSLWSSDLDITSSSQHSSGWEQAMKPSDANSVYRLTLEKFLEDLPSDVSDRRVLEMARAELLPIRDPQKEVDIIVLSDEDNEVDQPWSGNVLRRIQEVQMELDLASAEEAACSPIEGRRVERAGRLVQTAVSDEPSIEKVEGNGETNPPANRSVSANGKSHDEDDSDAKRAENLTAAEQRWRKRKAKGKQPARSAEKKKPRPANRAVVICEPGEEEFMQSLPAQENLVPERETEDFFPTARGERRNEATAQTAIDPDTEEQSKMEQNHNLMTGIAQTLLDKMERMERLLERIAVVTEQMAQNDQQTDGPLPRTQHTPPDRDPPAKGPTQPADVP